MGIKILPIASGSKGNSTLIMTDNTAILCDAGVSCARIKEGLRTVGLTLNDLSGVVVTHEHSDHIYAIPKINPIVPLYAHGETVKAIYKKQGEVKNYRSVDFYENGFSIGDISVTPFRIPHDAAYPLGYTFSNGGRSVSVATDMGIPIRGVLNNIKNSEVVLLESNYDVDMLKNGSYTPALKKRILGNLGHLSNDSSAIMAENLIGTKVQTLILGHISENNNLPELALGAVKGKLDSHGADICVKIALQHEIGEIVEAK